MALYRQQQQQQQQGAAEVVVRLPFYYCVRFRLPFSLCSHYTLSIVFEILLDLLGVFFFFFKTYRRQLVKRYSTTPELSLNTAFAF